MNKKITISILALLGLTMLAGCSKAVAPTLGDMPMDETIDNIDDLNGESEQAEPETIEVSSQREQISGLDSARSGYREGPVVVKSFVELDPWAFAGSQNDDELRADCNAKIIQGVATQEECPTNTILRMSRIDGASFPKQINRSEFNNIQSDIDNLTIGCVDDENYTAAPIRNLRDDLTKLISEEDQNSLIAAADEDVVINVRIAKSAYDIAGRGGSPCDIFFESLELLE